MPMQSAALVDVASAATVAARHLYTLVMMRNALDAI
jgi:hypothetical protein